MGKLCQALCHIQKRRVKDSDKQFDEEIWGIAKDLREREAEIWDFVVECLQTGQEVMLLVVTESTGSSPGRRGFKMAVSAKNLCGSIGGGVMEVRLAEQARENLKRKIRSSIVEQVHRKNDENSSGMICSGKQTVVFFKFEKADKSVVEEIVKTLKTNTNKQLRITSKKIELLVENAESRDSMLTKEKDSEFVYEEKIGIRNRLFIVGGGHCALALSELMSKLNFHISLFDDRPQLNTLEKNHFAHSKIVLESYEKIDEFIESGENNFVTVMTLGYKFDEIVIRRLLEKEFKYFGVLGSKAKMSQMFKKLKEEGFSEEKLKKIKTPIGLPINSQTPEEIAVSIAAEIIAVKNSAI